MLLQSEWRKLIMLHYPVNPDVLLPYLPHQTELETWNGHHYVSMVGFLFTHFRVNGIRMPFHQEFVEINLRFYVRHQENGKWKRGVVFIKEFVDKPIIAWAANSLYHQHYHTLPIKHSKQKTTAGTAIRYQWKNKVWHRMEMACGNEGMIIQEGSMEEYFTDQSWGFAKVDKAKTLEYHVEHIRWSVYDTHSFAANIDFELNYGAPFRFLNRKEPEFAFMAEGSAIQLAKSRWIQ